MIGAISQACGELRKTRFKQYVDGFVVVIGQESLLELLTEVDVEVGINLEGKCLYFDLLGRKIPLVVDEKLPFQRVKIILKDDFIVDQQNKLDKRLKAMFGERS